ncbi:carboxypeptidase regulatory-like domain-containing protein [Luteitalea sp.]|uniref:TonB-dependent receptor n=1 Tax=Luteitalea sp. TaxID=2004800 RepID=UPI0025C3713E|nr:carboxypeptidase regulatory-like domain-containing protein [Luteitalea sp.]
MFHDSRSGNQRALRTVLYFCLALLLSALPALAQTITGRIDGKVTDSSGGVLPGATVTVVNEGTGLTTVRVTDESGTFTITNLPVGSYSVTAELQGFRRQQRTGFELTADGRLTADFSLGVGELSESVEVTAVAGEAVNRTSGEVARTIDSQQIKDLAFNGRNYLELASLIPGSVATDFDPLALATSLSTTGQSINGNRGNTNNLTIDGTSNQDSGSNGSQVNNVSLSFIDQVKIQTSNFSAELGRNSGAAVNVVTRSGTNRYRGTARYDLRDEKFDSPNYFAPRNAAGERTKPPLEFRNFEGALGGPIIKNKLFFFGGQQYRTINRFTNPSRQTLPTTAELNGDFSFRLRGADGLVGTADDGVLRDPQTGEQFAGNVIPTSRITTNGRAFANIYRAMQGRAASFTDTPTANNTTFQEYNPFESRQDIVRLDWQATDKQRVYGRYIHDEYNLIEPFGTFSGAALPTVPTDRSRPGTSYQVGHTYVISTNVINEAKIGASWNGQRIKPVGDLWLRDTYGITYPELFDIPGYVAGGIPNVQVAGFASVRGPDFALLSPTTDITVQDTLTWIRGNHSIRSGVAISRNRKDQNGRGNYFGQANFNPGGNPNSTSNAVADMLLGNFRTYEEASQDPVGFFRFTTYQGFVSDTWRVRSNLSLEVGLRYEYTDPTYTQQNNLVNFDPSRYDPNQAVQVRTNGLLVPGIGNRFNGLVLAGDGIPDDQQGRVSLLTGGDYDKIPFGAPRGLYEPQHLFMPRFSFSYSLTPTTVVRGGVGLFYDKPEGNLVFSQMNLPPVLANTVYENFNIANPSSGASGAVGAVGTINAIDPNLELPHQTNYSIGVQKELGRGYFAEASYVGNTGRSLIRQPDINRASFNDLRANAALPSAQRVSENFLRPYKGYSSIRMRVSDASSQYHSMQLFAAKRRGDFQFTVSYTLGRVLTNASGNGDNDTADGANDLDFFYGPATFDRRHAFINTLTYRLPWLRDRGGVLEAVLGGWEASSKYRFQSGQYLTASGNSSIGGRRAEYLGGDIAIDNADELRWFNTAAFGNPPEDRRGTATVGQIQGPSFSQLDMSFRKNFRFGKRYNLTPIFDVFNLFNTVNLTNPNVNANDVAFGTINGAQPPRQFQIGARFDF